MKRKILIAGAGKLGSRYLQGLAKFVEPLDIYVFDPSAESLGNAEQRWNEIQPVATHEVRYELSLATLPSIMDLAVVASTADVRAKLIAEIERHADIEYWVLEKVLTQSVAEIDNLKNILNGKLAWVNTPMYLWPLYSSLRQLYRTGAPIEASFEGFSGLACNAIHYIDFVSRFNGTPVTHVDTSDLNAEWYFAKRDGFYEVDGQIAVNFADGSKLKLASNRNNLGYKVNIKIDGDDWQVSEAFGTARAADGRIIQGEVVAQSQLTAPLVQAIFSGVLCGLPTLIESAQQHSFLLNALLDHWNRNMPNKISRLPIT
jgi:hypothetical protein